MSSMSNIFDLFSTCIAKGIHCPRAQPRKLIIEHQQCQGDPNIYDDIAAIYLQSYS
jgi:hypothetical protein